MASNTGPKFAILAVAPAEWNFAGTLGDTSVALKLSNGEGWLVEIFSRAFRERLLTGQETWIFLAHIIREDAEILYAFESAVERALFVELRELDSVGPKTAALAVSALGLRALADILHGGPVATYKVSGLGPKTLEKLAMGMRAKQEKFLGLLSGASAPTAQQAPLAHGPVPPALLMQSMEKLGMRPMDTLKIYRELLEEDAANEKLDSALLVRQLLQRWGQAKSRMVSSAKTTETSV